MHTRPIWAEISRSRLLANFQHLQAVAHPHGADVLAVVKADAYGHGATLCAPWLIEAGASWLGVTSVEEGVAVRQVCPSARILVMCGIWPGEEDTLIDHALIPTVWTPQHVELLARAANRRKLPPQSLPIHLEIDTGMSRQGVSTAPDELTPFLATLHHHLHQTPALALDGVFTHFASPEVIDSPQNAQQATRFAAALEAINHADLHPAWIHAGNSSTLLGQSTLSSLSALATQHHARFLVRTGLALYGYALPFVYGSAPTVPVDASTALQPVLCWKTRIGALRDIPAGTAVGYGATFIAQRDMRLALLPVGYADGLNRRLSSCGSVYLRGHRVPIIGRVSMDLTVIDVTEIPHAVVGDQVILLGDPVASTSTESQPPVTAIDHAHWADTIPYEILCAISVRVSRVAVA